MQHSTITRTRCATFVKIPTAAKKTRAFGNRSQSSESLALSFQKRKYATSKIFPCCSLATFIMRHRQSFLPFCLRYMSFYMTMLRILSIPLIFLLENIASGRHGNNRLAVYHSIRLEIVYIFCNILYLRIVTSWKWISIMNSHY